MARLWAKPSKEGILLSLRVIPNSKQDSVCVDDMTIVIRTKAKPANNKANIAVLKILKPLVGRCSISSGKKGRKKKVLVEDMGLESVIKAFEGFCL